MFCDALKTALAERSMTAAELSAATGIGKSSISQYLSGAQNPPTAKKELIASALNLPKDYFRGVFSEQLSDAMTEKKINSSQLAQLAGVSRASISLYLLGKQIPPQKKKEQLAIALGLSVDFFTKYDFSTQFSVSKLNANLPVETAAMLMGKNSSFVRLGLQQGVFPWGYAVKVLERWSYYISPVKFQEYTGCKIPEVIMDDEDESVKD